MMNAADAMRAAERTLLDGLNAALRKPRRHNGRRPRPVSGTDSRDRSDDEN